MRAVPAARRKRSATAATLKPVAGRDCGAEIGGAKILPRVIGRLERREHSLHAIDQPVDQHAATLASRWVRA